MLLFQRGSKGHVQGHVSKIIPFATTYHYFYLLSLFLQGDNLSLTTNSQYSDCIVLPLSVSFVQPTLFCNVQGRHILVHLVSLFDIKIDSILKSPEINVGTDVNNNLKIFIFFIGFPFTGDTLAVTLSDHNHKPRSVAGNCIKYAKHSLIILNLIWHMDDEKLQFLATHFSHITLLKWF